MIVANKYQLVRKIGAGAMGEVWAARHKTLDEEVAIKLVVLDVDHGDGRSAASRFLLEARVAAQLSRKTRHIVAVTDHGQDGALGYLVMELLAGEPLDSRSARTGPVSVSEAATMVTQIARGLDVAHGEGIVHRDLKPANVFVTLDEEGNMVAKIVDFGIAKLRRDLGRKAAHETQRGFLLGTPAYMSPEQVRGKPIDHRADVWALAVIAYHLVTGEFPFDGESVEEVLERIRGGQPTPIRNRWPSAPPVLGDFFARAFASRVQDRFQSALALAGAFEQLEPLAAGARLSLPRLPTLPVVAGLPPRRSRLVAAAVVGAAVLGSTVALRSVYYEREPAPQSASEATAEAAPSVPARAIPPPEVPAEISGGLTAITAGDRPAPPPRRAAHPGTRPPSRGAKSDTPPGSIPPAPPSAAKPARSGDRSEIF